MEIEWFDKNSKGKPLSSKKELDQKRSLRLYTKFCRFLRLGYIIK